MLQTTTCTMLPTTVLSEQPTNFLHTSFQQPTSFQHPRFQQPLKQVCQQPHSFQNMPFQQPKAKRLTTHILSATQDLPTRVFSNQTASSKRFCFSNRRAASKRLFSNQRASTTRTFPYQMTRLLSDEMFSLFMD